MNLPVAKFTCLACGRSEYRMSSLGFGELLEGNCRCGGDVVVSSGEVPEALREMLESISKRFEVFDFVGTDKELEAEVETRDPKTSFLSLSEELDSKGYIVAMRKAGGGIRLLAAKLPPIPGEKLWVNLLLLLATACSTMLAGLYLFGNLTEALVFSSTLLAILGAHEAGHRLAAKRNNVEISNPYFLPSPFFLGTFGALIKIKKPIRTKEALIEMGFLGPLLGFLLALSATILGMIQLRFSVGGFPFPLVPAFLLPLKDLSFRLNPLLLSGWSMMIVTALNLLPAGQLDGGHILRGLMSANQHYRLTRLLGFSLLFLGFFLPEYPLWLWGLIILLAFSSKHPGALDDVSEVSRKYRIMAAVALTILILCVPIPTKL
ncbi:MAG: site-2 protease family protein [Candidatus Hadarchaeales archaeon]